VDKKTDFRKPGPKSGNYSGTEEGLEGPKPREKGVKSARCRGKGLRKKPARTRTETKSSLTQTKKNILCLARICEESAEAKLSASPLIP